MCNALAIPAIATTQKGFGTLNDPVMATRHVNYSLSTPEARSEFTEGIGGTITSFAQHIWTRTGESIGTAPTSLGDVSSARVEVVEALRSNASAPLVRDAVRAEEARKRLDDVIAIVSDMESTPLERALFEELVLDRAYELIDVLEENSVSSVGDWDGKVDRIRFADRLLGIAARAMGKSPELASTIIIVQQARELISRLFS